jgi:hypothetical protein
MAFCASAQKNLRADSRIERKSVATSQKKKTKKKNGNNNKKIPVIHK